MLKTLLWLSPRRPSELNMHTSAQKAGLAIGCNISYHDLPICVGHNDDGEPIVELKPWPFILPSEMVRPSNSLSGIGFIFVGGFSKGFSPWIRWGPNFGQWRVLGPLGRPEQVGWVLEPHVQGLPGPSSICECEWVFTDHALWCFGQLCCSLHFFTTLLGLNANKNLRRFHLWGDEGQSFAASYMIFHWQPELAPRPTDSASNRFLITTIPSSAYVYEGDVNITLQCAGQHICSDLTGLQITVPSAQGHIATWLELFWSKLPTLNQSGVWTSWISMVCSMASIYPGDVSIIICDALQGRLEIFDATVQPAKICNSRAGWMLFFSTCMLFQKPSYFFESKFAANPEPCQICWMCLATKGSHDLEMAYTNIAETAAWRETTYAVCPWEDPPSLSMLPGFQLQMLSIDILHVFHLGCGRDIIGSTIRVLARQRFWRGSNLDQQLAAASVSLKAYASENGLNLRVRRLTKQNLNWKSAEYPEAHIKGADTFAIMKWLGHAMEAGGRCEPPPLIKTLIWACNNLFGLLSSAGMFLTAGEQNQVKIVGNLVIHTYLRLVNDALEKRECLWRMRPKYHLLHHLILETQRPSGYNFHWLSTWLDEDGCKRWMTVKRGTHKNVSTDRTLRRWILGLRPKLDAVLSALR